MTMRQCGVCSYKRPDAPSAIKVCCSKPMNVLPGDFDGVAVDDAGRAGDVGPGYGIDSSSSYLDVY